MSAAIFEVYVPETGELVSDAAAEQELLASITHLGIAAHPDDLEIMAIDGILKGYAGGGSVFGGVVLTDGRGAPRAGKFAAWSDDQLAALRKEEQKTAARIGRYGALVFMNYASQEIRQRNAVVQSLARLLIMARPRWVYSHSLLDSHPTHTAAAWRVIQALRGLPAAMLPERIFGCEVWRGLEWLPKRFQVAFDCSERLELQRELLTVFGTQVESGKRYDHALPGRRAANATMDEPNAVDNARAVAYAMDLNPLARDKTLSPRVYLREILTEFEQTALSSLPDDA